MLFHHISLLGNGLATKAYRLEDYAVVDYFTVLAICSAEKKPVERGRAKGR